MLKATELLIYNQIAPRWQAFLNEENKDDAQAQQNLKKVMDWYGGKENMMESVTNPIGAEAVQAYQKRLDSVVKKLAGKKGMPVTSFEVKELIGEYGFVIKQMFRLRDESKLMRETAEEYRVNAQMKEIFDRQYGEGMALFFADAVKKFFRDFLESVEIYPEKLDNGFIMKQGRKKENGD